VKLKRGVVKHVLPKKIILTDGSEVPYGLLVWSTGVGPSSFVKVLNQFEKSKAGRMAPGTEERISLASNGGKNLTGFKRRKESHWLQ
jgi:NADH dehydrogenase FAD-containing subunit